MVFTGGALAFLCGCFELYDAFDSKKWPSTKADIHPITITIAPKGNHALNLEYSYQVEGKTYLGNRISFDSRLSTTDSISIEKWVKENIKLPEMNVYYQPDHPGNAVLFNGVSFGSYFGIIIGIVFMFFGSIFNRWMTYNQRKLKEKGF